MNRRIQRLKQRLDTDEYPICVEKARLIMEAYRQAEGDPAILRRAQATAYYLDHKTIFIEDDELIVGNFACKPLGLEADSLGPPWQNKYEGRGLGAAGVGWGLGVGQSLILVDYALVLNYGLNQITRDAASELKSLRYFSSEDIKKADFFRSVIIINEALVRLARRYAELARETAKKETSATRKGELKMIGEICDRVPGEPARTFRDLIVRVAGYSAYFNALGKAVQDEIIGRTEYARSV
jgi:pyruvate-formate lyase